MALRKTVSLIMGFLLLALGLIPILNSFGIIGFSIPGIIFTVIWFLAVVGGIFLVWDGISEGMMSVMSKPSLVVGLAILIVGIIPVLGSFEIIAFGLPGFIFLIINYLFALAGLFLIIGGFQGF